MKGSQGTGYTLFFGKNILMKHIGKEMASLGDVNRQY